MNNIFTINKEEEEEGTLLLITDKDDDDQKLPLWQYILLSIAIISSLSVIIYVFVYYFTTQTQTPADPPPVLLRIRLTGDRSQCNDGSEGIYYFRKSPTNAEEPADSERWIIYLPGGGSCWNAETCDTRYIIQPEMMSSRQAPSNMTGYGSTSSVKSENSFYQWNTVLGYYCSSDMWMGTVNDMNDSSIPYQFNGYHILESMLLDLMDHHSLSTATEIIFIASDTASEGLFQLQDRLDAFFSSHQMSAYVFYLHDNGWYGPSELAMDGTGISLSDHMGMVETWQPMLNADCVTTYPTNYYECMYTATVLPTFINNMADRMIVTLSLYDEIYFSYLNITASYDEWSNSDLILAQTISNLTLMTLESSYSSMCYVVSACRIHTIGNNYAWSAQLIDRLSVSNWTSQYVDSLGIQKTFRVSDTCGYPYCNPTCLDVN